MKLTKTGLFAVLLWPSLLVAQEDDLRDRFVLKLGAFYVFDSDTEFAARSGTGILGTSINFKRDLGGDESVTEPRIRGYYRFNPRHRIDFEWYKIERNGSRNISRELLFGDVIFPDDVSVDSRIETEIGKLLYTWSFYHEEEVELGFSIGGYLMRYNFALETANQTIREDESISAPLPVFGLRMDYSINPRWHLLFDIETFYAEIDDEVRGSLDDLQLAVEYWPFRHILFGAALDRLTVDASVDDDDYRGSVNDLYRGFQLYVGLHY